MLEINWLGAWTLYYKEVRRFLKVYHQTVLAPMINSLLFLAIFSFALSHRVKTIGGVPFIEFIAPGIILMAAMQNAFANTSSSLIMAKMRGTLVDFLMPPLSAFEISMAMVLAATTRGVMVGIVVTIGVLFFIDLSIAHPGYVILYLIMASMVLSLLGVLGAIYAETFDQMAAINGYVIMPLTFLSGTFYSIESLPEFWRHISYGNPFFYFIDGFRYGVTGYSDGSIAVGMSYSVALIVLLFSAVYFMILKGYRLKN